MQIPNPVASVPAVNRVASPEDHVANSPPAGRLDLADLVKIKVPREVAHPGSVTPVTARATTVLVKIVLETTARKGNVVSAATVPVTIGSRGASVHHIAIAFGATVLGTIASRKVGVRNAQENPARVVRRMVLPVVLDSGNSMDRDQKKRQVSTQLPSVLLESGRDARKVRGGQWNHAAPVGPKGVRRPAEFASRIRFRYSGWRTTQD
jgi:hypothetical protein